MFMLQVLCKENALEQHCIDIAVSHMKKTAIICVDYYISFVNECHTIAVVIKYELAYYNYSD